MERIPRNKRIANPPRMVLTARDKDIIQAVYQNRFLKRDQLERLFSLSTPVVNQRLKRLYQHEYLERLFRPVSFGSTQAVYALDRRGVDVVSTEMGIESSEIKWKRKHNKVEFLFLEHTLAIAEFRICLELALKGNKSAELTFWFQEAKCKKRITDPNNRGKFIAVTPDAFFGLKSANGNSYFFLEIDMGTESNERFKKKIEIYRHYWKSGIYGKDTGFKSFRVLTVTLGNRRLHNLRKSTLEVGGRNMFLFSLLNNIIKGMVLDEIWQTASEDKTCRII